MALKGQPKRLSRGGLLRLSHHQDLDLQVSLPFGALDYDPEDLAALSLYPPALSSPALHVLPTP